METGTIERGTNEGEPPREGAQQNTPDQAQGGDGAFGANPASQQRAGGATDNGVGPQQQAGGGTGKAGGAQQQEAESADNGGGPQQRGTEASGNGSGPQGSGAASVNLAAQPSAEAKKQAQQAEPDDQEQLTEEERKLKDANTIPPTFKELKRILEEKVGLHKSFDIILREMVFGSVRTGLFYVNGFAKDAVLTEILKRLTYATEEEIADHPLERLMDHLVAHIQVEEAENLNDVVKKVLSGSTAIFVENETSAIVVDAKNFPVRSVEEPSLERVVRGSRDGFVETLLTNVSLVRRRIRDPRLKLEIVQVGERTQTDVCIGYINDIADQNLVEAVRDKLKNVKTDGLPLADKQLEEAIVKKGWNPYPLVRYSERPDVISAHLLEGYVVIFVDTSPSVMIVPTTFFTLVQHAEEYRQTPTVGTYLRWVRFFGIFASLFLLPLWYLMVTHPELKPPRLEWIGPQQQGHLPLFLQFLFAELGIDLMRMAAVHTPSPLAIAMGLIAAILIGEIAVKTGLFMNEVILYLAVAAIGMFATPSYELSLANRLVRLALLLATAMFDVTGFVVGTTLWIVLLAVQRSYNSPYLWPFIPFNGKALFSIIVRRPFPTAKTRLSLTKPRDKTRQPV